MNKYQQSMNDLQLDENAKRRIHQRLCHSWEASRQYRIRFARLRTANICLSVFLALICVTNVAMATVKEKKEEPHFLPSALYTRYRVRVGEKFEYHDTIDFDFYRAKNGSFCWEDIAIAKSIQAGGEVYQARKDYFLICKLDIDMDSFCLEDALEIELMDRFGYATHRNLLDSEKILKLQGIEEYPYPFDNPIPMKDFNPSDVSDNMDLNLTVTEALSVDMNINWSDHKEEGSKKAGPVCGIGYLVFDITQDFYDYFYFNYVSETEGIEGLRRIGKLPLLIQQLDHRTFDDELTAWEEYESHLQYNAEDEYNPENIEESILYFNYEGTIHLNLGGVFGSVIQKGENTFSHLGVIFYANYKDLNFCDVYEI